MKMDFRTTLGYNLEANISSMYIQSYEWQRFQAVIIKLARDQDKKLYFYNDAKGLVKFNDENKEFISEEENDIIDVVEKLEEDSIYIFEETHSYLNDTTVVTKIKFAIRELKKKKSHLIFFSTVLNIPKELDKELILVDMPLPSVSDFEKLYTKLAKELNISTNMDISILSSLLGLTIEEATNAISIAITQKGKLTIDEIDILISQKEQIIKKSGHLEYFHPQESLAAIGGLDALKEWLGTRYKAFSANAKKYKLKAPKGIMLLGVPGTGKSLSAKAISTSWKMPLLRLDFGKVFGSLVGESESNIREAIKIAESLSPCILWIDEIEKGLSGLNGGGDSGTSSRVFGTFLTWMQEKQSEVFVLATANDISALPPELLRKGRFDEIFFVDLPVKEERKKIIEIHLENVEQEASNLNVDELAELTKGFSGAELEEVVNEALFNIFDTNSSSKPILKTGDLKEVIGSFYPLAKTMEERIKKLRSWAEYRTKRASIHEPEALDFNDKSPKLKQEYCDNIFMDDN
jgi:ATP-dependent 26S proteasome regulatory subunit